METKTHRSGLTLAAILDTAISMAATDGLESLTVGELAKRLNLSKSGVFSRIGSREALQKAVIEEYDRRFLQDVFVPAMREPRGLPRLNAMLEERRGKIQGDLEKAEATRQEAEQQLKDYREQLSGAREEANRIIEESRRTAEAMRQEMAKKAEEESAAIVARAPPESVARKPNVSSVSAIRGAPVAGSTRTGSIVHA